MLSNSVGKVEGSLQAKRRMNGSPCVCVFARCNATVLRVFCLQPALLSMR